MDVSLNYYGGNGGFYALWILLLGSDYRCIFKGSDQELSEVYKKHWNILSIDTWKSTEVWPDGRDTHASNLKNKVFFNCNPKKDMWDNTSDFRNGDFRIVVYTDIKSSLLLAEKKNAFLFLNPTSRIANYKDYTDIEVLHTYDNIKAAHWPAVSTYADIAGLPDIIMDELVAACNSNLGPVSREQYEFNSSEFNNDLVWYEYTKTININEANLIVKLQDCIQSNGACLLEPLGFKVNQACIDFTKQYLSLHSTELRDILLNLNS